MAYIMKQSGEPNHSEVSGYPWFFISSLVQKERFLSGDNGIEHLGCQKHGSQGMFKASMRCSRINKLGQSQLTDSTESLKCRMVDYLFIPVIERYETMHRVSYRVFWHRKPLHPIDSRLGNSVTSVDTTRSLAGEQ